jgi:hypothetical protein
VQRGGDLGNAGRYMSMANGLMVESAPNMMMIKCQSGKLKEAMVVAGEGG